MIICPVCNTKNESAYNFCESCGAELAAPLKKTPTHPSSVLLKQNVPKKDTEKTPTHPRTVLLKKDTSPSISRITVQLKFADGKLFTLSKIGDHDVGRSDAASEWVPAVDLTHHGGQPAGVSRRHATIHLTQTEIAITDFNSSNGTKQNGERLTPHERYRLHNGDELMFGRLLARLTVVDS